MPKAQPDASIGHPDTTFKLEWVGLFHGKKAVLVTHADADHLRELRRERAEVRSRLREAGKEVAAFAQKSDRSDVREAAQARHEALRVEMVKVNGEIEQAEASSTPRLPRQWRFVDWSGLLSMYRKRMSAQASPF